VLSGKKLDATEPGKDEQSQASNGCEEPNTVPCDETQHHGHQRHDQQQRPEIDVELNNHAMPEDPTRDISTRKLHLEIGKHAQDVLQH
jgi:hypothetical protein